MTVQHDLTADLTAADEAGVTTLEAVRTAVEDAIAGGQPYVLHAGIGGGALAAAAATAPSTIQPHASSVATSPAMVLRRDVPLQPASGPGALPAWAVGRVASPLARLTGALGQQVVVDLFPPVQGMSLRRASQAAPLLIVTGTTLEWGSDGTGRIGGGSVWLPATQFDPSVAAGSWCGLAVSGATITGARATLGPGGALVVPDNATLTVTVELAPPAAATGNGPGGDARTADVRLPAQASFQLAPAAASVRAVGPALLTAYGVTVRLGGLGTSARYVPALGALLVPLTASPAEWHPAGAQSTLATLAGGGAIQSSGWALPVTVADATSLGTAAGAGQLALLVQGLTLAVIGQQTIPAGDAWLSVEPGLLTVASDAALGTGVSGQIWLYPDPAGGSGVGGRAVCRYRDTFALRYLSSAAGVESIFAEAGLDVSLDRPVTVAGDRLPLQAGDGVVVFVQEMTGTTVLLEGTGDAPMPHPLMLALDNALLETGFPSLFLIRAEVTSQSTEIDALVGVAAIALPLVGALPTLPDPYASTITPVGRRGPAFAAATVAAESRSANQLLALVNWDARRGPAAPSLTFRQLATGVTPLAGAGPAQATSASAAAVLPGKLAVSSRPTDADLLAQLQSLDQQSTGSVPGPMALLDVSSAADLFGVRYATPTRARTAVLTVAATATASGPVIEGMGIVAPANAVRIITLPAVQWEPVSGPDATGPFSPLAFPDSGGETQVTSASVNLVEVAPNPAIQELLRDYNDPEGTSAPVVVSISFPFGIRAVAVLSHPKPPIITRAGASLDLH